MSIWYISSHVSAKKSRNEENFQKINISDISVNSSKNDQIKRQCAPPDGDFRELIAEKISKTT